MALTNKEALIIDKSMPAMQQAKLGTEIKNIQGGLGITLPTSDPGVAGALWNNLGVVNVSAG